MIWYDKLVRIKRIPSHVVPGGPNQAGATEEGIFLIGEI